MLMSRPSKTESAGPDFRVFNRFSCVHVHTFLCPCSDFRAFTRLLCIHQIFVRSCPDFRVFTRISCVNVQTFIHSAKLSAFNGSPNSCLFLIYMLFLVDKFETNIDTDRYDVYQMKAFLNCFYEV